jgi:hypothetical protein
MTCQAPSSTHPPTNPLPQVVEPKIVALRGSEVELRVAEGERIAAEAQLAEVQAELDAIRRRLDDAMANKKKLEEDAAACRCPWGWVWGWVGWGIHCEGDLCVIGDVG